MYPSSSHTPRHTPLPYTTLFQSQARQPLRLEDGLGLIKRRPREAEVGGCLSDRFAILADPPQHLVLDLDQVKYEIDRKSTRLNSSHDQISYAVFCLIKK